ncbi:MAG: dephospho-CoA kinase [Actinobacteria bacterium]|nr:dephospho-CoA kinase [Actinomycetota bacterium]
MYAIGLTGGIGAGKSAVAELLVEKGAVLIDADEIARDVVEPGAAGYEALIERFGDGILDSSGLVDRAAVARLVFDDKKALADLNAITHPAIGVEMIQRRNALEHTDKVVIMAIPLLKPEHREAVGLGAVVVVDCPTEIAIERLVSLRGFDRQDAMARVAAQISREERLAGADYVVDNSGSLQELLRQVEGLWEWILSERGDLQYNRR